MARFESEIEKNRTVRINGLIGGLLSSVAAFTMLVAANAGAQEASTEDGALGEIEEIVITGIRRGLKVALDAKRDSISIVDGISASDIADFPGYNITEELGRLPGVAITREDGEGQQITVRGLAAEFTRVTINGQTVTSGNSGREVDFDIFASELFGSATITKTPTASMISGGLAATVDLRTPKPLELDDFVLRISAEGSYNSLREEPDPRGSILISKTFADRRLGISLTAAYSETALRQDTSQPWRFTFRGTDDVARGAHDLTGGGPNGDQPDGIADPELATVVNPNLPRNVLNFRDRERIGLAGSVQFRPTDDLAFNFDILYADTLEFRNRFSIDGNLQAEGGIYPKLIGGARVEDGVLVAGTFANVNQRSEELRKINDEHTTLITADANWYFADGWNAFLKLSRSDSVKRTFEEAFLIQGNGNFGFELLDNGRFIRFTESIDHLNGEDFFLAQTLVKPNKVNDEENSVRFDLTRDFDGGGSSIPFLTRLKAGFYFSDRDADLTKYETRFNPKKFLPGDPDTLFDISAVGIVGSLPATDLFSGFSNLPDGVVTDFLIVDIDKVRDSAFFNQDATPDADGFVFRTIETTTDDFGQKKGQTILKPNFQPGASWAVEETTFSAYVESDFEFHNVLVNAGVRFVRTEQTSVGVEPGPNGTFTPITVENNYTNWLPALNARYNIDEDKVIRLTVNRSLTRPTLSRLAPGRDLEPTQMLGSAGNPELDPFLVTQFDIAAEWYFAEESLLSLVFFFKDMETFIIQAEVPVLIEGSALKDAGDNSINGQIFQISKPINGTGGTVKGLEAIFQQPFTFLPSPFDGLGVIANFTYADSDVTVNINGVDINTRLQGQSKYSYNLIGYYENEIVSVRVAWSWRDDFVKELRQGREVSVFSYGQLDLLARYNINDHAAITFEALNVTNAASGVFDFSPSRPIETNTTGTSYRLGLTVSY